MTDFVEDTHAKTPAPLDGNGTFKISQARSSSEVPLHTGHLFQSSRRVLNEQEAVQLTLIKERGKALHEAIDRCGHSREISIALTKLDESLMWAARHIGR